MAHIPECVRVPTLINTLRTAGLKHRASGKVGEMFEISPEYLLIVRTDRLSVFDFVLPCLVPEKGAILTAMCVLWLRDVLHSVLQQYGWHHMVSYGADIDRSLPKELRRYPWLQKRALVIKRMPTPEWECIVRGYLTGSGLKSYRKNGEVCGHRLPPGLHDGSRLPEPIFTPTTKAAAGHDEHVDFRSVDPRLAEASLAIYRAGAEFAERRGILIADTKFEFSGLMLVDEQLTPDSSRFWRMSDWEKAQARDPVAAPVGLDKEFARKHLTRVVTPFRHEDGSPVIGINKLDPENPEHVEFVSNLTVNPEVAAGTSRLYHQCLETLFGCTLKDYLRSVEVTERI